MDSRKGGVWNWYKIEKLKKKNNFSEFRFKQFQKVFSESFEIGQKSSIIEEWEKAYNACSCEIFMTSELVTIAQIVGVQLRSSIGIWRPPSLRFWFSKWYSFSAGIFQSSSAIPRTSIPGCIWNFFMLKGKKMFEKTVFLFQFFTSTTLGSVYSPFLLSNCNPLVLRVKSATTTSSRVRFLVLGGLVGGSKSISVSCRELLGWSMSSYSSIKLPTGMFWSWTFELEPHRRHD